MGKCYSCCTATLQKMKYFIALQLLILSICSIKWSLSFSNNLTYQIGFHQFLVFFYLSWKYFSLKYENSVIYSPSICCKSAWVSFLCWTQKTIFWRMLVTKQLILFRKSLSTVCLPTFFKESSFVLNRRKKLLQVWKKLGVGKWWENLFLGELEL